RLKVLIDERRSMEKELADARKKLALGGGGAATGGAAAPANTARKVGDYQILTRVVHGLEPKDLRGLVDEGKAQIGSGIVAMVGVSAEGKTGLAIGVTADLTAKISAVDLVKVGVEALGGKGGGGRPDFAQAGGPDASKAEAALEAIAVKLKG
ncbi:MAG: DHHA1 domain-containing protein, partial [Hyphomicrobiaceae bacterium]